MVTKKRGLNKRVVKSSRRKENFFVENYKASWHYIKESKSFIYWSIGVFVFGILAGAFLPTPPGIKDLILKFIADLIQKTSGLSYSHLMSFIFFNNVQSSFSGLVYGIVFGIFPVIASLVNGYLLGFVALKSVEADGVGVLWRILPHGIFELPALFISLGMGIKLGSFVVHENRFKTLRGYLLNSLRVFFLVVVPLLIIAALIESALIFFLS